MQSAIEPALDVGEVSEIIGVSEVTIKTLAKEGILRGFKTSNAPNAPWRFTPQAVRDYMDRNAVKK